VDPHDDRQRLGTARRGLVDPQAHLPTGGIGDEHVLDGPDRLRAVDALVRHDLLHRVVEVRLGARLVGLEDLERERPERSVGINDRLRLRIEQAGGW
jgi:hypothetical protein